MGVSSGKHIEGIGMKNLALTYYQRGSGCTQSILLAAEKKYNLRIDSKTLDMAGALNTGIGIGGMCSVLIAAVMVLGAMFDEETAKRLRITFLNEFHKKYGGINCSMLLSKRRATGKCSALVYDAAEILETLIERNS